MILQKADLFQDVSPDTMNEITKIMVEESYENGSLIYKAGDPANSFYIIVEGTVRLSIGSAAEIDYTANRPGEAFGLTGVGVPPNYVTTAECTAPCKLVKIEKEKLNGVLSRDPASGMAFFKRLSEAVIQRLVANYGMFLSEGSLKGVTYGSGQVMGSEE